MADLFEDFMILKIMDGDEEKTANRNADCVLFDFDDEFDDDFGEEDDVENFAEIVTKAEQMKSLREELSCLEGELLEVELNEPSDSATDAYTRWQTRMQLLEEQILDVKCELIDIEFD